MAGSGGKLTKWLVNKTVVEPTKRKVNEAKERVAANPTVKKIRGTPKDLGKCEVCEGETSSPRYNLCSQPACAKAMARGDK